MISPIAFKLAVVYLLPYIYMASRFKERIGDNIYMTTSYITIDNVVTVSETEVEIENMIFRTKYIANQTAGFILVDLPPTIGLCTIITLHAPMLHCKDRDTIKVSEMEEKLDTRLVRSAFGVLDFNFCDKASIGALIRSGIYNYPFMVQSFPSLAVKLRAPIELVEGNDCGAVNCSIPRVADFFIDGARDTAVYVASHYAIKYLYNPYIAPTVNRWFGPPLKYLSGPFRRWYNGALYSADHLSARSFEAGAPAAPENIHMSTISREIAEGLPPYRVAGPSMDVGVQANSINSIGSVSSDDSLTLFKSPISSGASTSMASGSATGVVASSRDAPILGAVRGAGGLGMKYPSMPILPNLGRSTQAMSTLSQTTVDSLVQVPTRTILAGQPVTFNIIRSNNRNVLATLSRAFRRIPKVRRRRQASTISRQIATGIRATNRLLGKIPSWVGHTALVATPWVFSGVTHLTTLDLNITVIHPIQRLASYERYFIAMATLLFSQCFHNAEIRQFVEAGMESNDTLRLGGRRYTAADIVFNLQTGMPGDTLRVCSPFFASQVVGLGGEILLETLSVHFDTSSILEDVLFYNGPAKYIINDYSAYFNDVFPNFSPYSRYNNRGHPSESLVKVAEYDTNFARTRRGSGQGTTPSITTKHRKKRASYTYTARDNVGKRMTAPNILLDSGSSFTMSVQALLDTPKLRYEFDILQAVHYNTSFLYYKSLRHFVATSSVNFNDVSSHSSFKVVGNITLVEIMRGMNPFDLYAPRLNVIRELINGYDMEGDIRRLRRMAVKVNSQLEYSNIPHILGLFYLLEFPTDLSGYEKIVNQDVPPITMQQIGAALYRTRYSRVPLLIVTSNNAILLSLKSMFMVHVRVLEDIKTWALYSPVMLTTSLTMISSGAYTICVSKTKSHTSKFTLFGDTNAELGVDALFADACDLATLHITFDNHASEILENQNMPDRLKSLLSIEPKTSYQMPSGGLYDPIVSEVINMVEPSHRLELDDRLRGAHDEGDMGASPERKLDEPRHSVGSTTQPTTSNYDNLFGTFTHKPNVTTNTSQLPGDSKYTIINDWDSFNNLKREAEMTVDGSALITIPSATNGKKTSNLWTNNATELTVLAVLLIFVALLALRLHKECTRTRRCVVSTDDATGGGPDEAILMSGEGTRGVVITLGEDLG